MKTKLFFIFVIIFLLSLVQTSFASVVINEVQLSPTDSRFIELHNTSNSSIDLTGYYLQRKTATGSSFSSLVSSTNFENKSIPSKGYFLISRSSMTGADIIISNLTLTESNTIQLKNPEGEVVDKICWGTASDCSSLKTENPPEGKSIQRTGNNLFIGTPTPKIINQNTTNTENDTNTNNEISIDEESTNNILSNALDSKVVVNNKKPSLKILAKNSGFVGIPIELEARIEGVEFQNMYGKYVWNFGDGSALEIKGYDNKKFTHAYYYAGDYLVNVEYFNNPHQTYPDYTSRFNLRIIPANILISSVGDEGNFFIEITNTSSLDVDISSWALLGNNKVFTFPGSTNLLSMKKIILSPRITNFNFEDRNFLELLDKNGTLIFSYKNLLNQKQISVPENKIVKQKNTTTKISQNNSLHDIGPEYFEAYHEELLENQDLTGAVILSASDVQERNNFMYIILFIFLIICATLSVYFLRRNRKEKEKNNDEDLEDFEILDE
jgi:hypothetical protein